jgi:hypothetical protein
MCSKTVHWYYVGRNRGVLGRIAFPRLFEIYLNGGVEVPFKNCFDSSRNCPIFILLLFEVRAIFWVGTAKESPENSYSTTISTILILKKVLYWNIGILWGGEVRGAKGLVSLQSYHHWNEDVFLPKVFFLFLGFPGFSFFIIGGSKLFEEVQISAKMMFVRKKEKQGSA